MEELIIGSSECKIYDIVVALRESACYHVLLKKSKELALLLNVTTDFCMNRSETETEVIFLILETWRSCAPEKATLGYLIHSLQVIRLNECADLLKSRFENTCTQKKLTTEIETQALLPGTNSDGQCLPESPIVKENSRIHHINTFMSKTPVNLENTITTPAAGNLKVKTLYLISLTVTQFAVVSIVSILMGLLFWNQYLGRNTSLNQIQDSLSVSTSENLALVKQNELIKPSTLRSREKGSTQHLEQRCEEIVLTSFMGYQQKIFKLPHNQPICIFIHITKDSDWKTGREDLGILVTEKLFISGTFEPTQILYLKSFFLSAKKVTLESLESNKHCSDDTRFETKFAESGSKTILYFTNTLVFKDISQCPNIVSFMATHFLTSRLEKLEVYNSTLEASHVIWFQKILEFNRYRLKEILLYSTIFEFPLFKNFTHSLLQVTYIKIEGTQNIESKCIMDEISNVIVPNLSTLIIRDQLLSWLQYIKILSLRKIEILEINIKVPKGKFVSLYALTTNLPLLRLVKIDLTFEDEQSCIVLGSETSHDKLGNLEHMEIESKNCHFSYKAEF